MLGAPVVLVVDAPSVSASVAATVRGFVQFPGAPIVEGILANRLQGPHGTHLSNTQREIRALDDLLHSYQLPACLGCIPEVVLKGELPPSGCLQEANHTAVPLQLLNDLEQLVLTHIQVEDLVNIAGTAQPFEFEDALPIVPRGECRIAVADDSCFGLCFQDNIDLLRLYGAEIVSYSPLADSGLPRSVGGVYIPGAYLAEYGQTISTNKNLYRALKEFCDAGGVIYSEGAGTAFLCKTFKPLSADKAYEGVGLIPAHAVEHQTTGRQVAVRASIIQDSVLGNVGAPIAGLATDEWQIKGREIGNTDKIVDTLRVERAGHTSIQEGYSVSGQSCSTLNFLHFGSNPEFARFMVLAAATHQKTGSTTPRGG
jgi:cobyrinic acid a,c-diamide synthase